MSKKFTHGGSKRKPYLTKRMVIGAAKSGVKAAARETKAVMQYTVVVDNGWVVRKNANGTIDKLEPIDQPANSAVKLD
jgi:hypothetical protein